MASPCSSVTTAALSSSASALASGGPHCTRASPTRTAAQLQRLPAMRLRLRQEEVTRTAHCTPPRKQTTPRQHALLAAFTPADELSSRKRHHTEISSSDAVPEARAIESCCRQRAVCCPPPSSRADGEQGGVPGCPQRSNPYAQDDGRLANATESSTTRGNHSQTPSSVPCTPSSTSSIMETANTPSSSAPTAGVCEPLPPPPQHHHRIHQHELHPSDFSREEVLGEGSYSVVTLATHRASGLLFALKEIDRSRLRWCHLEAQLRWEINLQRTLRHPNIVRLYSYFITADCISLVLEYCRGGTLLSRLQAAPGHRLPERQASRYTRHVAKALAHLHALGVAHRDLKLENVLIDADGIAKLADFGWSRRVVGPRTSVDATTAPSTCNEKDAAVVEEETEPEGRRTVCGTLDYLSPEMVSGQAHSAKTDVWSLGVMLAEMLTGKPPFYAASTQETLHAIRERSPDLTGCRSAAPQTSALLSAPVALSAGALSLVHAMLQKAPTARPTMDEVLRHPWVQKPKRTPGAI